MRHRVFVSALVTDPERAVPVPIEKRDPQPASGVWLRDELALESLECFAVHVVPTSMGRGHDPGRWNVAGSLSLRVNVVLELFGATRFGACVTDP
jgi:hypothetical protein